MNFHQQLSKYLYYLGVLYSLARCTMYVVMLLGLYQKLLLLKRMAGFFFSAVKKFQTFEALNTVTVERKCSPFPRIGISFNFRHCQGNFPRLTSLHCVTLSSLVAVNTALPTTRLIKFIQYSDCCVLNETDRTAALKPSPSCNNYNK